MSLLWLSGKASGLLTMQKVIGFVPDLLCHWLKCIFLNVKGIWIERWSLQNRWSCIPITLSKNPQIPILTLCPFRTTNGKFPLSPSNFKVNIIRAHNRVVRSHDMWALRCKSQFSWVRDCFLQQHYFVMKRTVVFSLTAQNDLRANTSSILTTGIDQRLVCY